MRTERNRNANLEIRSTLAIAIAFHQPTTSARTVNLRVFLGVVSTLGTSSHGVTKLRVGGVVDEAPTSAMIASHHRNRSTAILTDTNGHRQPAMEAAVVLVMRCTTMIPITMILTCMVDDLAKKVSQTGFG